MMRHFLVTKFVCAKCGGLLEVSYDQPSKKPMWGVRGEPTGAEMVEQYIFIKPCEECLKPLEDVKNLGKAIQSFLEGV